MEKDLDQVLVLGIHKHGKNRLLYLPKRFNKIIPDEASLIEVELKRIIA